MSYFQDQTLWLPDLIIRDSCVVANNTPCPASLRRYINSLKPLSFVMRSVFWGALFLSLRKLRISSLIWLSAFWSALVPSFGPAPNTHKHKYIKIERMKKEKLRKKEIVWYLCRWWKSHQLFSKECNSFCRTTFRSIFRCFVSVGTDYWQKSLRRF